MDQYSLTPDSISLVEAHEFVAHLVSNGQTEFLPIFERLEKEVLKEQKGFLLLERARQVSASKKPIFVSQSAF